MGAGSSSPRSIAIEKEEGGSGMVKISESVTRRLVGKHDSKDSHPPTIDEPQTRITVKRAIPDEQLQSELDKVRDHYEKKVRALEKQNREVHKTTVEQFAKAVEDVEKKFLKTAAPLVCDELQNKLMQCYRDNPNQVLNCSQMVRAYSSCVEHERGSLLKNSSSDFYLVT
ncbi:hypothetical protein LSH36_275g01041 [Paralvinella palmiformis]|uniref:MICOS complex subunit MIC19 n=1 Tax=Paralvinella palmiformis TaxID=53620 RepID=A0AAD9JKJ1_9ANNE|nr:hypothetical protein LSH36_275g01041 [Paralvinella palmiformis]